MVTVYRAFFVFMAIEESPDVCERDLQGLFLGNSRKSCRL